MLLSERQRVDTVSSASTAVLLPLLKEHSFSLPLGPVENTAVQTHACDLTGTDGSYREAFGSPPLAAALNPW